MSEVRFDVPIPEKKVFGKATNDYKIEELSEIGAFKFYAGVKTPNMWSALTYFTKKHPEYAGWKFMVRKYEENGIVGAGVWRVE